MVTFESYERRIAQIEPILKKYGYADLEAADAFCKSKGVNVGEIVRSIQPIAFENAVWAYTLGAAIAFKKGCSKAADAAEAIGEGLQAFCIPVRSPTSVRLGAATVTWPRCFCAKKRNASASWPATNRSPRPRALSVSPAPPTKSARRR